MPAAQIKKYICPREANGNFGQWRNVTYTHPQTTALLVLSRFLSLTFSHSDPPCEV